MNIMAILVKRTEDQHAICNYIFDAFSKYQDSLQKEQFLQVLDIFSDKSNNY